MRNFVMLYLRIFILKWLNPFKPISSLIKSGLFITLLLFTALSCRQRAQDSVERAYNEEEIEITNNTSKAVAMIYVDSLYTKSFPSRSFVLNVPANTIKKLDLGRYYLDEGKGVIDYCDLRSLMIMSFADGKIKRDTSCFVMGGQQNFKDQVNFFNQWTVYSIAPFKNTKVYTIRYTVTDADYNEAK